jgi:hypothetical protein
VAEFLEAPLDEIDFDPENPRFPTSLDGTSETSVLRFMLDDAGLIDLMRSIAAQGFFVGEPLLVVREESGRFLTIEGNRRLAASKLLASPAKAPSRKKAVAAVAESAVEIPSKLPILVFENRPAILKHLGYRHVTGIKEWEPLAKARFLRQRYEDVPESDNALRDVARTIGSRADYVGRLLVALHLYEIAEAQDFFGIDELSEDLVDFSLITSVLAYNPIVQHIGLDTAQDVDGEGVDAIRLAFLLKIIFERVNGVTRLGESRNIRLLADIVESPVALKALVEGDSLFDAHALSEKAELGFSSLLVAAEKSLKRALPLRPSGPLTSIDAAKVSKLSDILEGITNGRND